MDSNSSLSARPERLVRIVLFALNWQMEKAAGQGKYLLAPPSSPYLGLDSRFVTWEVNITKTET